MHMKMLSPAERLVIDVEFDPPPDIGTKRIWAREETRAFLEELHGTGVCMKTGPLQRACDYGLVQTIRSRGFKNFVDLKAYDVPRTLARDGMFLREVQAEFVTVACMAGVASMRAFKRELPDTKVIGVTVLTNIGEEEFRRMFKFSTIADAVVAFAELAKEAGLDGITCAPTEAAAVRAVVGPDMWIVTPDIRLAESPVPADDQNTDRSMTPMEAIRAGADYIVVGRPVTRSEDPHGTVKRIIEEIASAAM